MKFMHISDVHLGVEPDIGKPWSGMRAQDIWDTFAEVIGIAAKRQPDFLFISGDLFHAQPLKKEMKEVNRLFAQIPATKIILCAGNHDHLRRKSYYLTNEWAENVFFFKREEVDCFDFWQENVAVYGMSYWHREIRERIYENLTPVNPARLNILLAHGGDGKHIPFSASSILQNGFDYVAAGHIHKGSQIAAGKAVMAGSLQPTDCNDTGPHGYWLGEIEKGCANVHFFPIKKCEYCHEIFAVNRNTTEQEILEWAESLLRERPKYQYFRLFLKGYRDPEIEYNISRVLALDRIVDVTKQMMPDYDYKKLAAQHPGTLLSNYIKAISSRPQDAVTTKALEYGVNVLVEHKG